VRVVGIIVLLKTKIMMRLQARASGPSLLAAVALAASVAVAAAPRPAGAQMGPGDMASAAGTEAPVAGGPVTRWSLAADRLGRGAANWRTQAIMHKAMHDALNAAEPRYARWAPAAEGEPPPDGAAPRVAMAAAAYQVLLARHPEQAPAEADRLFRDALREEAPGPAINNGIRLGASIGLASVARHAAPTALPRPFPVSLGPGQWRPTPPFMQIALVGDDKPLLFGEVGEAELRGPPPPRLDEDRYRTAVEEVRRLGGSVSGERTEQQRAAAYFWAYQSSQRGFVHLAVALMAERPLRGGAWDEARAMSQLTAALADSFVMAWEEKRHFAFWRPVTAINQGSPGIVADPRWEALIPTPPHPDYPSGHSADCSTGARVLEGVFGAGVAPFDYPAVGAQPSSSRRFATFADAANECGESRIWAGAHFRFASMEGLRIGTLVGAKALKSVPPLASDSTRPPLAINASQPTGER
jgi:hypothetical protein